MSTLALLPLGPAIDSFFEQYGRIDGKFELIDGQVIDGRGGTAVYARVTGNIVCALVRHLRGTGFEAMNGQMGLWLDPATVVYPDVAVYGDSRDLDQPGDIRVFLYPKIVFEATTPATYRADYGRKLLAYKQIDSVAAVVLIDPIAQLVELHERVAPNEWRHLILPPESGVSLRDPAVELSFTELFATD